MPETTYVRPSDEYLLTAGAATDNGELWFMPDGYAARQNMQRAGSSGEATKFNAGGKFTVPKATGVVFVAGGEVWWDHSAGNATYKPVNDRDTYLGTAVNDAASADTFMEVDFGKRPMIHRDLLRGGFQSVIVGTAAAGGFGYPVNLGGAHIFELTGTNEAQKVDALGIHGFSRTANAVVDFVFRVISDGSGSNTDVNIGLANGTHATSFDSITEYLAVHLDGNSTNINLQSTDGTTTVAAADTTFDYTEGSTFASLVYVTFDLRIEADIQCYVNGALALGSTTFSLNAAAGPLYPIVHVEKTSSTDTYKLAVDRFTVRLMEQ